jgi:hypothetical protein
LGATLSNWKCHLASVSLPLSFCRDDALDENKKQDNRRAHVFAKIGSRIRLQRPLRGPTSLVMAALIAIFALSFSFATPQVARAGVNQTHDWDCNGTGSLGIVCATAYPNGYNAQFVNGTEQCFWADFNLMISDGRVFGDEGAFWSCPEQPNSYFFAVGAQGCAMVIVYDRSNGQSPQSSSDTWHFTTCDPN